MYNAEIDIQYVQGIANKMSVDKCGITVLSTRISVFYLELTRLIFSASVMSLFLSGTTKATQKDWVLSP